MPEQQVEISDSDDDLEPQTTRTAIENEMRNLLMKLRRFGFYDY